MPRADDPYLLRNGTLQNKLGIKDAAELQRRESKLAAARENVLLNNLPRAPFTYATLKRVHHDLFQDVYDWAGQQRTGLLRKAALTAVRARRAYLCRLTPSRPGSIACSANWLRTAT